MGWIPVKADHSMGENNRRTVFQIADETDIANPPDPDCSAIGSVAYLPDMSGFWVKDNDGTWTASTAEALALMALI